MPRCFFLTWFVVLTPSALLAAEPVDYLRDVKPILRARCFSCHGALKQNGKLRLDTVALMLTGGSSGPVIQRDEPTASELIARISETDDTLRMPPEGKPLTKEQIATFTAWIQQGAKAPADEKPETDPKKHWAFLPPKKIELPKNAANPVDALLAIEWTKRGLQPVPTTDKTTLLRRVTLDLIGVPPTREELHAFLNDASPQAYEKVVDRLLASPMYGERWGRRWMDVWRYSDWYGRRTVPDVLNSYGQIWRWRDWIVRSLNDDRGYDEMVRLMLAADELAPTSDADLPATGFIVRNFFRWNYNNWMRDNVEHVAKAFLGLTFNCCHCHDHKYDPISQEEYFRMRAIFEPIEIRHERTPGEPDPGVYPKYNYTSSYKPIASGMVRVMDEKLDAKTFLYSSGDERNIVKGREPVPPGVPAVFGGTFRVEPVNLPVESWYPGSKPFMRREEITKRDEAVKAAESELQKAAAPDAKRLAEAKLAAANADRIAILARIAADDVVYRGTTGEASAAAGAASQAERHHVVAVAELAKLQAEIAVSAAKTTKDMAKIASAEKVLVTAATQLATARKNLTNASTTYTPLSPSYPKTSTGRRSAFARWLTQRDHPLTARVAVNHIWSGHFGQPLVETTNNFGRNGKLPTHPELLDWLAVELMDHGWNMKPIHRLIVTSQAYRMQSKAVESANAKVDPDNVFLWKFPTIRLEAEAVRDSLLFVAGELDVTIGGKEIEQSASLDSRRRSVYISHHGEARMEFLDLFDAANPCDAYRRTTSVLPQQALALANSELANRMSRALAGKLTKLAKTDEEFVRVAFEQVLSRPAREAEHQAALRFLTKQRELFAKSVAELKTTAATPGGPSNDPMQRARENFALALLNHSDFVTVR